MRIPAKKYASRLSGNQVMGLGVRRRRTSCFCVGSCLPYTRPFDAYWVSAFCTFGPSYGNAHYLYRFERIESDGVCLWLPVVPHLVPPGREELRKRVLLVPPPLRSWVWELTLFNADGGNTWLHTESWTDPGFPPIEHEGDGSCDKIAYPLLHETVGPACAGELLAAYPDACDDSDYPAKVQRKPLTWQP